MAEMSYLLSCKLGGESLQIVNQFLVNRLSQLFEETPREEYLEFMTPLHLSYVMKSLAASETFDIKVLTEIGQCLMTTLALAKPVELVEILVSHS